MTTRRPNLRGVCAVVESMNYNGALYLKLTEAGGFELLKYKEEGAFELVGNSTRQAVRKALDAAEKYLNDRRKEVSKAVIEEE